MTIESSLSKLSEVIQFLNEDISKWTPIEPTSTFSLISFNNTISILPLINFKFSKIIFPGILVIAFNKHCIFPQRYTSFETCCKFFVADVIFFCFKKSISCQNSVCFAEIWFFNRLKCCEICSFAFSASASSLLTVSVMLFCTPWIALAFASIFACLDYISKIVSLINSSSGSTKCLLWSTKQSSQRATQSSLQKYSKGRSCFSQLAEIRDDG